MHWKKATPKIRKKKLKQDIFACNKQKDLPMEQEKILLVRFLEIRHYI